MNTVKKEKRIIVISFICLIIIALVVFMAVFVRGYDDKLFSELSIHSNIESLSIFKNGYDNIFSFDGFIENDALLDIVNMLEKNDVIENTYSIIDLPVFLSIRKASIYIDMSVSEYLTESNIIDGRMYRDGRPEIVIGSDLAKKYNINKNTVVAIITEDAKNMHNANNFFVSGIAKFDDSIKDNKGYISLDSLARIIKKPNYDGKLFTQKIDITVNNKSNIEKVSSYIKKNLSTNHFELKENTLKHQIFTSENIKQTYKLVTLAFTIAIILIILSLIRLIIFWVKK